MAHHGKYKGVTGVFADGDQENSHIQQARQLSAAGKKAGIASQVVVKPGAHSWTFAKTIWVLELPWLAKAVGVPGAR